MKEPITGFYRETGPISESAYRSDLMNNFPIEQTRMEERWNKTV